MIANYYLGNLPAQRLYLGNNIVWESAVLFVTDDGVLCGTGNALTLGDDGVVIVSSAVRAKISDETLTVKSSKA